MSQFLPAFEFCLERYKNVQMSITKVALEVLDNAAMDLFQIIIEKFPELKKQLKKDSSSED